MNAREWVEGSGVDDLATGNDRGDNRGLYSNTLRFSLALAPLLNIRGRNGKNRHSKSGLKSSLNIRSCQHISRLRANVMPTAMISEGCCAAMGRASRSSANEASRSSRFRFSASKCFQCNAECALSRAARRARESLKL